MTSEETGSTARETWNGPFNAETYAIAHRILDADQMRAASEIKQAIGKRARVVAIVAIIWAICSVALAFANPDFLLVAEIGWVAVVAWAVFWMWPSLMGRANLDDVYEQYAAQLDKLEQQGIAMPEPSSIEDLIAAIDLVSPKEGDEQSEQA